MTQASHKRYYFSDFDKFYWNFKMGFQRCVNQNTWQHQISALKTVGTSVATNVITKVDHAFWDSSCPSQNMYKDLGNPENLDFFGLVPKL